MQRRSNILRSLETRAGYRALQWDLDLAELGRAWPREFFFWQFLMQLRSVSRLLYPEYPYMEIPSEKVTRLEQLLRERRIEYQEMLPKGIWKLWHRLGLNDDTGLRIGGIPLTDEELLEGPLHLGFPKAPLGVEMYAVDAPITPWFRLFEEARELPAPGDIPEVFFANEPSTRYLQLLNKCVCALYVMDLPYVYEMHTVRVSDDQMLAMVTEAARRSGLSVAQGQEC